MMSSSRLVLRQLTKSAAATTATTATTTTTAKTTRKFNIRCFSATAELVPGIGKGKTSTGIVGLKVDHDAISKIIEKNQALLDRIEVSDMPADAAYRTNVEAIAKYRINVCQENPEDPDMVEELVQMGQVEELVNQADNEMAVLEMYLDRRMWEQIAPVTIEFDPERDANEEKEETK